MAANLLTLNSSTTEFHFIGLKQQLGKLHDCSLNITYITPVACPLAHIYNRLCIVGQRKSYATKRPDAPGSART